MLLSVLSISRGESLDSIGKSNPRFLVKSKSVQGNDKGCARGGKSAVATLPCRLAFRKPVILVLNKADRYCADDRLRLRQRRPERIVHAPELQLGLVSSARAREVMRVYPDGGEEPLTKAVPARAKEL